MWQHNQRSRQYNQMPYMYLPLCKVLEAVCNSMRHAARQKVGMALSCGMGKIALNEAASVQSAGSSVQQHETCGTPEGRHGSQCGMGKLADQTKL